MTFGFEEFNWKNKITVELKPKHDKSHAC